MKRVQVAGHVDRAAGIAVGPPGAARFAFFLEDEKIADARLAQLDRGAQVEAETAADHQHIEFGLACAHGVKTLMDEGPTIGRLSGECQSSERLFMSGRAHTV
ncbi:hypothetical protein LP420_33895 [Massilia sp. B-10]|nr:hypothetical protein LP420_33895 [Massilia sp. B-10]